MRPISWLLFLPLVQPFAPVPPGGRFSPLGETVERSVETASSEGVDLPHLLQTLEKRLEQGPGSLSPEDIQEFNAGTDKLLGQLQAFAAQQEQLKEKTVEASPVDSPPDQVASPAKKVSSFSIEELRSAVLELDSDKVSEIIQDGLDMDEKTTNAAFWTVVKAVDKAEQEDKPLSGDIAVMLHHIFDADLKHLLTREQITTNLTCMQPKIDSVESRAQAMNYIFDDSTHKDLPLVEGRRCEGGHCCDKCSRNIFPTFASYNETSNDMFDGLYSFTFNELKRVPSETILMFTRLIERVRRTIAHEYGLPLKSILPLQAYSRKYVAGSTQQGGGGGEGDFVTLHTDEGK